MHLKGEGKGKSRVAVMLWDRNGKTTGEGKGSITFTVEETTMEELAAFIKKTIRETAVK